MKNNEKQRPETPDKEDERLVEAFSNAVHGEQLLSAFKFLSEVLEAAGIKLLRPEGELDFQFPVYVECSYDLINLMNKKACFKITLCGENIWKIILDDDDDYIEDPVLIAWSKFEDWDWICDAASTWLSHFYYIQISHS